VGGWLGVLTRGERVPTILTLCPAGILVFAIALTVFAPAVAGGDESVVRGDLAERLDRFLSDEESAGFNGSVLIAEGGRVILHKGYGYADSQRTERVTVTTPFWIASISKQFAAAAVLTLVERGRLSLQDSLARFFPGAPPDKSGITLHQLLTHTAGLAQNYAADGIVARDDAVAAILARPLARPPGEGFGYSNDGYNLIAAIVEVSSGLPYETYVRKRLLDPAGLAHTGFWGPGEHPEVAAMLYGEARDSSDLRPNWGYRGATGMYSTSGDLYRWYVALDEGRVLSKESRDRMLTAYTTTPGGTGVGYGWFLSRSPGNTSALWTRGYEDFGHGAVLADYPEDHVTLVVTSNSGERTGGRPVSHELSKELAVRIFHPGEPPQTEKH
jgi:CubicO group peptidase (beta-lactamase class C family)